MARKPRVQYPGAVYHVLNRGDRREPIFKDEPDHLRFLETLGEACAKTGWKAPACCLMWNHFHLVVETPQANLMAGMKWFPGTRLRDHRDRPTGPEEHGLAHPVNRREHRGRMRDSRARAFPDSPTVALGQAKELLSHAASGAVHQNQVAQASTLL